MWKLYYTRQSKKDAQKLASTGLKQKAQSLLKVLENNPFQSPPPYEKLLATLVVHILAESTFNTDLYIKLWKQNEK